MIPETSKLNLVFLELISKRKLIGFIDSKSFDYLFNEVDYTLHWFNLYHPVEAHVHMITRDFLENASFVKPSLGIQNALNHDPALRQRLALNNMGENSPLLRYYNDLLDKGPVWRLFYVYLAGCDYAKPEEPLIRIQTANIEIAFPYKEESDQQLKILYDVEIRKLDPKTMVTTLIQPEAQSSINMVKLSELGQQDPRYLPPEV